MSATTEEDIKGWFMEGKEKGATHIIVVCDTFSYEDYPIFVMPDEDVRKKSFEYGRDNGNGLPSLENDKMSKVMEVYSLSLPMEDQLKEFRAWHFD